MFIQNSLAALSGAYSSLIQGNREPKTKGSADNANLSVEIPVERLSKATLDQQSDGTLRLMTLDRCGFSECRLFSTEARLDAFLHNNETVDIWEIEDKRTGQTFYKYYDGEEEITLANKKELYNEIASGTDYGIFSIYDLDVKKSIYIQQKKDWLHRSFEKISLEQAQKGLFAREKAHARWRTIAAIGIAALAVGSIVKGIEKFVSRELEDLTNPNTDLFNSNVLYSLQKTALMFGATLLSSETLGRQTSMLVLSSLVLIHSAPTLGQTLCPKQRGTYDGFLNSYPYSIHAFLDDYVYLTGQGSEPRLEIIDVTNKAEPALVGFYKSTISDIALSNNKAYIVGTFGFQILDINDKRNPVFVSAYNIGNAAERIEVVGTHAYIYKSDSKSIFIVDISNSTNPLLIGETPAPHFETATTSLAVSGNTAYRLYGGVWMDYSGGVDAFDVSNVTNPRYIGSTEIGDNPADIVSYTNKMYVVYNEDHGGGGGLSIDFNVGNRYFTKNPISSLAVSGNYAFLAQDEQIQIIDVQDSSKPTCAGLYSSSGTVIVFGDYAYISGPSALEIIDISVRCRKPTICAASSMTCFLF